MLTTSPWRARPLPALSRPRIAARVALALEVLAVAAILVLAAVVRADAFMVVPRLADETQEVILGLRLAREGGLPLIGFAPHIGSLFTYLVAGTFLLLGPKIEAGRLLVLTIGVLTIVPTYLLGRDLGRTLGAGARAVGPWGSRSPMVGGFAGPHGRVGEGQEARDESLSRGRLVGLIAALLLAFSGPHIATSSRIAYSNSLTPLFIMTGLWLAHRAIVRRSDWALVGSGAALGLAVQTHVSALTIGPGVLTALLLPRLLSWKRGDPHRPVEATNRGGAHETECRAPRTEVWPRLDALQAAAGAFMLMVANLLIYNLFVGSATASTAGNRIGRYVGESPWSLQGWGERLAALLQAAALAVGGYTSEVEAPAGALLSPVVAVSVGLALLGLWIGARRGQWLPLLVTASVLLAVSLLNGRVEPIVPRVRHYATLVPLGATVIAVALVWLHDRLAASQRTGVSDARERVGLGIGGSVWLARAGLVLLPLLLAGGSLASYGAYEAERLSRPDKNNAAYLATLDAVAASGSLDERLYLDEKLIDLQTLSGGRMLTHLRYAFEVRGQELDTIDLDVERLPIGQRGTASRRLIVSAESVEEASQRYRLEPLPGEPGEGAPLRAFRAFPLHD